MKTYFRFGRNCSKEAFGLKMDYSLAEVNPLAIDNPEPVPKDFLQKFSYGPAGAYLLEDMLANNMGWHIFSARIARLFSECSNRHEIESLPLPEKARRFHPKLAEYRVLGIKRQIACLDEYPC